MYREMLCSLVRRAFKQTEEQQLQLEQMLKHDYGRRSKGEVYIHTHTHTHTNTRAAHFTPHRSPFHPTPCPTYCNRTACNVLQILAKELAGQLQVLENNAHPFYKPKLFVVSVDRALVN